MDLNPDQNFSLLMNNTVSEELDRCSVRPSVTNLVLTIVLSIICAVAFFGNAAVLVTVACYRCLHSATYILLVSLATADLLVSVFSMPWRIHQTVRNNHWCLGMELCAFWIWIDSFACCASITNLAAVGVERFVAIKSPLRYHSLMNNGNGFRIVCFVWLYSIIWASLGNLNWSNPGNAVFKTTSICGKNDPIYYTVVAIFAFYMPLLIVILTYSYLTHIARVHAKALQNLVSPEPCRPRSSTLTRDRIATFKREIKATKMMAGVVGAFFICWFPFFVLVLKSLWSPSVIHPVIAEFNSVLFVTILPNLNSALNPFIYIAFTRELRQAALRLLRRVQIAVLCKRDENANQLWARPIRSSNKARAMSAKTVECKL